jgi:hypothetical protein
MLRHWRSYLVLLTLMALSCSKPGGEASTPSATPTPRAPEPGATITSAEAPSEAPAPEAAEEERIYDPRECTGREPPKDKDGEPLTGERALASLLKDLEGGGPVDRARWAAIKRCGSCHPREYKNWAAGPHAAAHETVIRGTKMMAEESFTAKNEEWNIFPKRACCTCHCSRKNVFDDQISPDWKPGQPFTYKPLCLDEGEEVQTSGIDCLTCHAQGDKILAMPQTPERDALPPIHTVKGEGPRCDIVRSDAFAHINACVGCHWDVDAYQAKFDEGGGKEFPYLHCDECHMQRDEGGRYTHLYYFKGERQKNVLKPAFERLQASIIAHEQGRALRLLWVNDFLPHHMLHATPMIYQLVVDVSDPAGGVGFSTELRFYSKHFRNNLTPKKIRGMNPTGELINFRMGDRLERIYPLPMSLGARGTITLTVRDKDGHDFPDSTLSLVSTRTIPFGK